MNKRPAPTNRRKRRLKIVFILGFNLILLLVIYILFVRVTEGYIAQQDRARLIYDYNPLRRQVLLPDQQYQLGDVRFSINEYGFRGQAPKMPKPDGMTRIITMGGSSVFDHHVGEGKSWPERIAPLLLLDGAENVESFNCGIPGYSSRETLSFYIDKIRYLKPDYVLLYHGWNDLKYVVAFKDGVDADAFFYPTDYHDHNRMFKSNRPLRNWYALQAMYRDWRDAGAVQETTAGEQSKAKSKSREYESEDQDWRKLKNEWADSPGMAYFRSDVEMFVQAVLADGATPVLVAQNTLATPDLPAKLRKKIGYRFVRISHSNLLAINEAMADVLRQTAEKNGTPFVDLRDELNGRAAYFRDHVHMSPDGSRTFARLLATRLAPIMGLELPAPTATDETEDAVLVGHWPFDEIRADFTPDLGPSRLHGRLAGSIDIAPEGHKAQALVFNGEDSEITVENTAALHLDNAFLIEAWVRLEPASVERDSMGLVIKGGEYYLVLQHGRPAFFGYGLEPKGWQAAGETVPVNRWVRVAASYDGETLRLMIDDREVLAVAASGRLDAIDSPLTIGGLNGNFLGRMDDVRILRTSEPAEPAH